MSFSGFIKRHKIAVIITSVLIAAIIVGVIVFMSILSRDNDIKYNEAVALARKQFGLDKVLWISSDALMLASESGDAEEVTLRSHYAYYIVGEKDGEEIYCIVPSNPKSEKPFLTTWNLDYTFTQIVEKFNEQGACYIADVPNDYYGASLYSYIKLNVGQNINNAMAEYHNVDGGYVDFYARLDVKAVFSCRWESDNRSYSCIVTQENGELKAYMHNY